MKLPGLARRSPLLAYGVTALSLAGAFANVWVLHTTGPVASFMLAVILSAWIGGTLPGTIAVGVSAMALTGYFLPGFLSSADGGEFPRIAYFLLISSFIVWVIDSERRSAQSLRRMGDELARRNEALRIENIEGKALEDLLRRSESELRQVIDTIPTMAWSLLPDGRLEFLNRRRLDYTGMSLEDAVTGSNDTIHPDDRPAVIEHWQRIMASGETYDVEMRLRRADGEFRWFLVRTVPLRDEGGRIVRWYGTSIDIEDRMRADGERRRGEQALRESAARLQQLSRRLIEVQEQERRHLARELHDEFGQLIAGIRLRLHVAKGRAGEAARAELEESISLLEHAGEQIRSLVLELRPTLLETSGLEGTLHWLARQHQKQSGLAIHFAGQLGEVSGELATTCFRVAQEALTNIVQHGGARTVWIELGQNERSMQLEVRDDGVGFDVAATLARAAGRGHVGLLGMRERVEILGGSLQVESSVGAGTRIRVELPLARVGARPPELA